GVALHFDRDAEGRITKATSPALDASSQGVVYSYDYDAAGDLVAVHRPGTSAVTSYGYSPEHRLLTTRDPNGNPARTSTYYPDGRLQSDTDALSHVTSYAYDLVAHKTTTTNPDLGVVTQTFDDRGLLLQEVDPLGHATHHTYDGARNELTQTNALGEV